MSKQLKKLDKEINDKFAKHFHGVQIPIFDLSKIDKKVKDLIITQNKTVDEALSIVRLDYV